MPGTGLWVGDYTIEPENGGVGVFAHEFGHDLGLPDLYDTDRRLENGTGFWSLMSSGSWASIPERHRDQAGAHGRLGEAVPRAGSTSSRPAGDKTSVDLGPAEGDTSHGYQAAAGQPADLPEHDDAVRARRRPTRDYFYSGKGDSLDRKAVAASAASGRRLAVSFRANCDIETDWDYAYLEA